MATKPTFRNAYNRRRCLVLSDGQPHLHEVNGGNGRVVAGARILGLRMVAASV